MPPELEQIARSCLEGAETGAMTFPQIVGRLMEEGFESYTVDFRRARVIYYRAEGDSIELDAHKIEEPVAAAFNEASIVIAIREAQQLVEGYTYNGFCKKVMAAGCTGYIVSFPGRRAVYFGRTAETHVEAFP